MKKVLVVGGSLQSDNMGINALTRGLLKGIYELSEDHIEVKLISFIVKEKRTVSFEQGKHSYLIEEIPSRVRENFKVLLKYMFIRQERTRKPISTGPNWRYLYRIYSEADLILDVTGGDSFTDLYGVDRFIYTSFPKVIALMMKKKLILMPQTMGPFKYKITRAISRYIVNNAYMNYARDGISYNYLVSTLRVPEVKAALAPDLAFNMLPAKEQWFDDLDEVKNKNKAPLVGINISALLFNGGYTGRNQFNLTVNYKDLVNEIIHYFIKRNCTILLVPHVINLAADWEDDYSLCKNKSREIKERYPFIYSLEEKCKEDQIKALIGKCDFFIGSRMHACIGAISMGVPTVPIAYSRKFIGIWELYGMKECIADAQTMDSKEIMDKIDQVYNSRERIKELIQVNLKNVKEEIDSTFKIIMSS